MQEPHPLPDARAQFRAQLLLDVLAGRKTARQAAAALGVSRKTWHEWQQRGLEGMLDALIHADRAVEHDTVFRVGRSLVQCDLT